MIKNAVILRWCNKRAFLQVAIVQVDYICSVQISNTMATINFLYRSTKDKANLHLRLLYRFNDTDFVIEQIPNLKLQKTTG
jgi:hypothetical protein